MIIDSTKYNGACSCGREHKMETRFCVIESGALKKINEYLEKYGLTGTTAAIYDENTYKATADRHPAADCEIILDPAGLHADEHGVEAALSRLPESARLLLAVGSGTIHDITRYCANKLGVPFVSCPTAASVDGFCSSVAAMTWGGCKKTFPAVSPQMVIADIDVIKNAPLRLAKSGIGDMLGKFIALTDWKISAILTNEFYCERIVKITLEATKAVLSGAEGILKGSEKSFFDLTYGLIISGLAMQMMGNSRPASGAEHHISHIIEMSPPGLGVCSDALHGEKVGVGTVLLLREYKRLAALCDPCFTDYKIYSDEELLSVFGEEQINGILEENRDNPANLVTADVLKNNWQAVRAELAALPEVAELEALYEKLQLKTTLADIDVPGDKEPELLYYAPAVRKRLTFLRLRGCVSPSR